MTTPKSSTPELLPRTKKLVQAIGTYSVQCATTGDLAPSSDLVKQFDIINNLENELLTMKRLMLKYGFHIKDCPLRFFSRGKCKCGWKKECAKLKAELEDKP